MTISHTYNPHFHHQPSISLVNILFILILLPILVSNDQQYLESWGLLLQQDQNHTNYHNLFSKFKQINITSRVFIKLSSSKETTLSTQSTTLILESDYLKMYKNKLTAQININITLQIINSIKNNLTFIETSFYFVKEDKNYLVEKQIIPLIQKFSHEWRQGIEHFMIADMQLLSRQPPQTMILKQMDIYFFQINHKLLFSNDFQGSEAFGMVTVQFPNNKATDYYYPRPLATKINTRLKENYASLQSLEQEVLENNNVKYQIRLNVRIGSQMFPLMMHTIQAIYGQKVSGVEDLNFDIQGMKFGLQDTMQAAQPFIIRYFKKLLFQGSILSWVFLITQTFITLGSKLFSLFATLLEVQIFKNPVQYRGMSLYCILTFVTIDVMLIVMSFGYLGNGDLIGPLVSLGLGMWKISKMVRIQLSMAFPIVKFHPTPWYQVYYKKDQQSFISSTYPIMLLTLTVMAYPFVKQAYLVSQMDQPLPKYLIHRFVLTINEYRFVFGILTQIILNHKLQSNNSLPWKYLIVVVLFFSVDNSLLPVTTSIWEFLFFLKQEILLLVLIIQKLMYGNSLSLMPYQERPMQRQDPFENRRQAPEREQDNQQKQPQMTQVENANRQQKKIPNQNQVNTQSQRQLEKQSHITMENKAVQIEDLNREIQNRQQINKDQDQDQQGQNIDSNSFSEGVQQTDKQKLE